MRIVCNTNITLDVLLEREPYVKDSGFGIAVLAPDEFLLQNI